MNLWRWLVAKWWLVYGIGVAAFVVSSTLGLVVSHPDYSANEVNYLSIWWSSSAEAIALYPLIFLLVAFVLYGMKTRRWRRALIVAILTFVALSVWLSLLSPFINLTIISPRMFHVASIDAKGDMYNLASYDSSNFPGSVAGYVVYECDTLGIFCRKLHQAPFNWMLGTPQPRFQSDENSLQLFLNGELVFTKSLQDTQ